jgi:hypothetical protein
VRVDAASTLEAATFMSRARARGGERPVIGENTLVSQLGTRAALLNQGFQDAVMAVIRQHSAGGGAAAAGSRNGKPAAPEAGKSAASDAGFRPALGGQEDAAVAEEPKKAHREYVAVQCAFGDDDAGSVEVHPAPVKTVARMCEKLAE